MSGLLFHCHMALFSTATFLLTTQCGPIFDCHMALFSFDKNSHSSLSLGIPFKVDSVVEVAGDFSSFLVEMTA